MRRDLGNIKWIGAMALLVMGAATQADVRPSAKPAALPAAVPMMAGNADIPFASPHAAAVSEASAANAWGGPSYLGAMACHYLDAALMIAAGAWLLDKILPSAVAAEGSTAPRSARRVQAVSH